ncbi:MAG: FkbM family methyltransferase, partial [Pseudomonadales bacterium]
KLDLIKLDVEAHEAFVLRGLKKTLEQHKPIITMEWNDPLTIERLNGSDELQFLFEQYNVYVLGSNYDRSYWQHHSFSFIRRKLTRLFKTKKATLFDFNPAMVYKNLLLIPKSKQALLDGIL